MKIVAEGRLCLKERRLSGKTDVMNLLSLSYSETKKFQCFVFESKITNLFRII